MPCSLVLTRASGKFRLISYATLAPLPIVVAGTLMCSADLGANRTAAWQARPDLRLTRRLRREDVAERENQTRPGAIVVPAEEPAHALHRWSQIEPAHRDTSRVTELHAA